MCDGDSGNLVLTGFMGTGKTVVGQAVARRLGRPFVDIDAEIEARAGKPIPRVFAEDGEAAFRQLETALCEELSTQRGLVVATGGGALVDPGNRARMMESGTVVCLTCGVDEILNRVKRERKANRPLLDVSNPRAEIERLLEVRREAYQAIPWQVDTTGLSLEQVATRVIQIATAQCVILEHSQGLPFQHRATAPCYILPVRYPGGDYAIHIGEGLLAHVGEALRAAGVPEGGRVAIVSNPVVAPLYGAPVEEALRSAGLRPFACTIPDGEQHKTLPTVAGLYEQFLAGRLDRSGTVLALGGGVTGDVVGFAAASYMRGVRFVSVPTTLLAMVDASVGGKTGVDLPQGKNLVGAFKQPALVVVDPTVLATLPPQEIRSGLAEVIKHGIIGDPDLFAELEARIDYTQRKPHSAALRGLGIRSTHIARALGVKIKIVEKDPFEKGRRAVLNLGHTVGHALEKLSGFGLRHGAAVGIGMVAAAQIAVKLGRADPALAGRIEALLAAWGLPVRCPPLNADAIWEAMAHDKKRQGRGLRWVLPRAIGEVEIVEDVPPHIVSSVLLSIGARSKRPLLTFESSFFTAPISTCWGGGSLTPTAARRWTRSTRRCARPRTNGTRNSASPSPTTRVRSWTRCTRPWTGPTGCSSTPAPTPTPVSRCVTRSLPWDSPRWKCTSQTSTLASRFVTHPSSRPSAWDRSAVSVGAVTFWG
jgi:3-dehydroquinate synthase